MERGTATADEQQRAASCATCVQMMMVGWCDQFSLGDGAGTAWQSSQNGLARGVASNTTEANSSSGLEAHLPRLSGGYFGESRRCLRVGDSISNRTTCTSTRPPLNLYSPSWHLCQAIPRNLGEAIPSHQQTSVRNCNLQHVQLDNPLACHKYTCTLSTVQNGVKD
jgi:hypothetical protein